MIDLSSLCPIDVGFDPRVHAMPILLDLRPGETYRITYEQGRGRAGKARRIEGAPETVCRALVRAGYRIIAARTPNGRDIDATRWGFHVQPRNDNYWINVATLADALAAFERPQEHR